MSLTGVSSFAGLFSAHKPQGKTLTPSEAGMEFLPSTTQKSASDLSLSVVEPKKKPGADAAEKFLDYMKKTPAERMFDAWLEQRKISKEAFEAMSPEEKQKLITAFKQEIELKMKEKIENASQKQVDVFI